MAMAEQIQQAVSVLNGILLGKNEQVRLAMCSVLARGHLLIEDIPGMAEDLIYSVSQNPVIILLMVNVVMILIGMLMDDISGLLLSAPLLLPIVQSVGMDPVHFAAVLGVNLGMANITPPTAPLLHQDCDELILVRLILAA